MSAARTMMRRLLSLAALIFALCAIDAYAFHGRYRAAALEDVNYYAKTLDDGVQNYMRRLRPSWLNRFKATRHRRESHYNTRTRFAPPRRLATRG
jgi:hypothetical protein